MYAAVLTRIEEEVDDELTGGWKVVEVSILFCDLQTYAHHSSFSDGSSVIQGLFMIVVALVAHIAFFARCIHPAQSLL